MVFGFGYKSTNREVTDRNKWVHLRPKSHSLFSRHSRPDQQGKSNFNGYHKDMLSQKGNIVHKVGSEERDFNVKISSDLLVIKHSEQERIKNELKQTSSKAGKVLGVTPSDMCRKVASENMRSFKVKDHVKRLEAMALKNGQIELQNPSKQSAQGSLSHDLISKFSSQKSTLPMHIVTVDPESLHRVPKRKKSSLGQKLTRCQSESFCKQYGLRYLTKYEIDFVRGIYNTKRVSMMEFTGDDDENVKAVVERHKAIMEDLRQRKIRQRVAHRMVTFSALNLSRKYSDVGQPVLRTRSYSQKVESVSDSVAKLARTFSDPDLYATCLTEENPSHNSSTVFDDSQEVYTPYTAVGSHEDIHQLKDEEKRKSVQQMLSRFEQNSPSQSTASSLYRKPIPLPRPDKNSSKKLVIEQSSKAELNSAENGSQVNGNIAGSIKKPPRPKPKPKPLKLLPSKKSPSLDENQNGAESCTSSSNAMEQDCGQRSDLQVDTGIDSTTEKTSSEIQEAGPEINYDTPSSNQVLPSYQPRPSIKQNPTRNNSVPAVLPYAVVKLQSMESEKDDSEEMLPPKSPPSCVQSPSSPSQRSFSLPLSPVVFQQVPIVSPTGPVSGSQSPVLIHQSSVSSPKSPVPVSVPSINSSVSSPAQCISHVVTDRDDSVTESSDTSEVYLEPVEAMCQSPVSKNVPPLVSPTGKSKRRRDLKKSKTSTISKSFAEQRPTFLEDAKRRQSLPEHLSLINDQTLSPDSCNFYEEVTNVSDDDRGWDSDEFESTDEEEFEMVEVSHAIPKMPHLEGAAKKIYNIVTEILTTERSYVSKLYLLDKVFHERIVRESRENGVIPEKVVKEIFPNLSPIYSFHSTILLPELEKRIQEWGQKDKIGDIFKTLGHCLLLYTEFVKNFDHATTTLSYWLKKSPKFAALVDEMQKRPECESLTLQHHMLSPVQRIPRYKLLLQDYLKKLPADSPDRQESEASLLIISKAAEHANNSMKENDKFKKLLDIEDRIVDGLNGESLVTASRVFLKEGELTKVAARKGSKMSRTILLFNDILLCCILTATGKLRVRQVMDVVGLIIDKDDAMLPENAFRIKSRQRVLDLIGKNSEEKEEWVVAIRAAVDDLHDRRGATIERMLRDDENNFNQQMIGQNAPLWVKDEDVTMCMLCALKFGMVHRKHHCRGCGRVVCDKCSNYRAQLSYAGNNVKRVCFACSKKLGVNTDKSGEEKTPAPLVKSARTRDSTAGSDMSSEIYWKVAGKSWTKEWLVLSEFVLYVQKKRQDVKAHTTVPVPGYEICDPTLAEEIDTAHPHCIKLHKQNKKEFTYFMSSDNQNLILQWESHLKSAVMLEKLSTTSESNQSDDISTDQGKLETK